MRERGRWILVWAFNLIMAALVGNWVGCSWFVVGCDYGRILIIGCGARWGSVGLAVGFVL